MAIANILMMPIRLLLLTVNFLVDFITRVFYTIVRIAKESISISVIYMITVILVAPFAQFAGFKTGAAIIFAILVGIISVIVYFRKWSVVSKDLLYIWREPCKPWITNDERSKEQYSEYKSATSTQATEKQPDPAALISLANKYRHGEGFEKDVHHALSLFQQAAFLDNTSAMVTLSYLYAGNEGVDANRNMMILWARKAANLDEPAGMFNLGLALMWSDDISDKDEALMWFQEAEKRLQGTELGIKSQYEIGAIYADMAVNNAFTDLSSIYHAYNWLNKAAEAGNEEAKSLLVHLQDLQTQQRNQDSGKSTERPEHVIVSCPHCNVGTKVPIDIKCVIVKCKKCRGRYELNRDRFGTLHVIRFDEKTKTQPEVDMPTTRAEALEVLGLSANASLDEIKNAYRSCIQKYHPDKVERLGDKLKSTALKESKRIIAAYHILNNS